ncbi:MFS transporter [Mammaliicoccus vitulinus]|uniref:MFS transporter n=2 Tax=Mammaliicoccus vitulinus TaxID=71237 RepID=UPI000E68334F|nr:MFS transporter [Mammaliicoccus vitulinus]RIN20546.1 MFS transporter [Mammaliicoccus vitulinus]
MLRKSSYFSSNFYKLLLAHIFTNMGEVIFNVTIITLIYSQTGSVFGSTLVIVISMLAKLIGSYFGSNFIFPKYRIRNILIVTELLRIVFIIIFIILTPIHHFDNIPLLFILVFLINISNSFFAPGRLALMPALIEKNKLILGNSWFSISNQLTQTVGWAIAVPIVNILGNVTSIYVYIILFILSLLLIVFITSDNKDSNDDEKTNFRISLKFIKENKIIREITVIDLLETSANIIWMPTFLLSFTLEVLKESENVWGFQGSAYTLGSFLGSIFLIRFNKKFTQFGGYSIILSALLVFILTMVYSINTIAIIAIIVCFLDGPAYQIRDTVQKTILQTEIPLEKQSSIYSTINTFLFGSYIISLLLGSYLADIFGIRWVFIVAGLLYFLSTLVAFYSKRIRNYKIVDRYNE